MQKTWKNYWNSSESTQREPSFEYQHDRVSMVFKNLSILVLWTKMASALEELHCQYLTLPNNQARTVADSAPFLQVAHWSARQQSRKTTISVKTLKKQYQPCMPNLWLAFSSPECLIISAFLHFLSRSENTHWGAYFPLITCCDHWDIWRFV